jgi:tetratricopeptide (TPR) repeat protein
MQPLDQPVSNSPPGQSLANFCTQCGVRAAPNARFCGSCGTALASLNAFEAAVADDTLVGLRTAQQTLQNGDVHAAVTAIEAICAEQPAWPSARVLLGIAYLRAGRVHDAQDALEAAERLGPDAFACEMAFAEYHARLGFHDRAVARLERALALPAPDARARDAAVELHRYCSERARTMFYRRTPLPRWTSRLLGRREHTVAGQLNPRSPRSS